MDLVTNSNSTPILEINDLSVSYGPVQALKNISIQIQRGSIVSILGANGAGKTTLMKCMIGALNQGGSSSSQVQIQCQTMKFQSTSILKLENHKIVQMGMSLAPEGRMIFSELTVYENLVLGTYAKKITQKQLGEEMEKIFSLFPVLKERRFQLGGTLSGGEQQMLAIGRAWISSPQLLLLDEPSLGVSPLMMEKIFETLVHLNRQGTSILLAEQNALMALEISHDGYVLDVGKIAYVGKAQELIASDHVRKAYLGIQ